MGKKVTKNKGYVYVTDHYMEFRCESCGDKEKVGQGMELKHFIFALEVYRHEHKQCW